MKFLITILFMLGMSFGSCACREEKTTSWGLDVRWNPHEASPRWKEFSMTNLIRKENSPNEADAYSVALDIYYFRIVKEGWFTCNVLSEFENPHGTELRINGKLPEPGPFWPKPSTVYYFRKTDVVAVQAPRVEGKTTGGGQDWRQVIAGGVYLTVQPNLPKPV